MKTKEVFYYRATNAKHTNYFRLSIQAQTDLGVSELRMGWFPARSVDSLFGDVSSAGGLEALQAQADAEKYLSQKTVQALTNYVDTLLRSQGNTNEVSGPNRVRQLLLAYPADDLPQNMRLMDFNPIAGLENEHENEKFVIVLSSNPDEVLGKIANFTEADETALSIKKLSGTVAGQAPEEIQAQEIALDVLTKEMRSVYADIEKAASTNDLPILTNSIIAILQKIEAIRK